MYKLLFLLFIFFSNSFAYDIYIYKKECKVVHCVDYSSSCDPHDKRIAQDVQSRIVGFIQGMDYSLSKFTSSLVYNEKYNNVFYSSTLLTINKTVDKICSKVMASPTDKLKLGEIVETFYREEDIKRFHRVAKNNYKLIIFDEDVAHINKIRICKKSDNKKLFSSFQDWDKLNILSSSAFSLKLKTSTGKKFYLNRDLTQYVSYKDINENGYVTVTPYSDTKFSITFLQGKDLQFVDYSCTYK